MGRTVEELLASISSAELAEWMAYYTVCPFGEERADFRQAITSMILANQWRGKNSKPAKLAQFMPFQIKPKRKQTQADMKNRMTLLSKIPHGNH